MTSTLASIFAEVGVRGWVHARCIRSGHEIGLDADDLVVLASVVKVPLVLELVEAELHAVRPDVALVPAGGGSVHDYVGRMLRALGRPRYVFPTHWDDFDHPLTEPARDWGGLDALRSAVTAASPSSRFVVLDHLETWTAP